MIKVDVEAYFKDRNWRGFYYDRNCLYDHPYDRNCSSCKHGEWQHSPASETGISPWGGKMDTIDVYYRGEPWRQEHRQRKDILKRVHKFIEKYGPPDD